MNYFLLINAGILSCIIMDIWQRLIYLIFKIPSSNWSVVGRWLFQLIKYKIVVNTDIENSEKFKYEKPLGWFFHYLVGILYSFIYFIISNKFKIITYSFNDALFFGIISVFIPWFFFLPVLGKGILASNTENPRLVCFLSLLTHIIFGLSLGLILSISFN